MSLGCIKKKTYNEQLKPSGHTRPASTIIERQSLCTSSQKPLHGGTVSAASSEQNGTKTEQTNSLKNGEHL